jgi:hypothetical protein
MTGLSDDIVMTRKAKKTRYFALFEIFPKKLWGGHSLRLAQGRRCPPPLTLVVFHRSTTLSS